jgi:CO/xanthine dehydrogenase Mo-binding subunit
MTMIDTTPSRRSVLAGLGGLTFCIAVGNDGVRLMSQAQANALANASVTPWVRIAPDGRITILSAGAEMGQGSMTSLPLIVAEEMDADRRRSLWLQGSVRHRAIDVDRRQPGGAALFHAAALGRRPGAQGADR